MTAVVAILLALAVLFAWVGTAAFLRFATDQERLHAVTFVNVATGGAITIASLLADGFATRSLKCVLLWVALLFFGALLSHVSARALSMRSGERP